MTALCSIGFHCTFLNKATMEMGTYVAIKSGNVKRKRIFLKGLAKIFFHSVIQTSNATINIIEHNGIIVQAKAERH